MSDFNRWAELAGKLKPAVQKGVKEAAYAMKDNIQGGAPVGKGEGTYHGGFMRDNVYVSAPGESTYGQGMEPPTDDVYLLPEIKPENDLEAVVGAAANYSEWVNGGTRHMAAQPFFDQGVETTRGEFETIMTAHLQEGLS